MNYEVMSDESPLWPDATDEEVLAALQAAIDSGEAWFREDSVGRLAMEAIEKGDAALGPEPKRDYYGNLVPAWWMVEPGTRGSPEYAGRPRPEEPSREEKIRLAEAAGLEIRMTRAPYTSSSDYD